MHSQAFEDYRPRILSTVPAVPAMDGVPEEYSHLGIPILSPDFAVPVPPLREGCSGGEVIVGGVRGLHITREGVRGGTAHMHIHGGGFTMGSAMNADYLLYHFLEKTNVEQYSVEYGLAPYHKHPEPVENCLSFYMGLRELGYERIIIGGESAGGGLTLSLLQLLKQRNLPMPLCAWASSPVVDLNFDREEQLPRDMFTESAEGWRKTYCPDADLKDPVLSPLRGDYSGLPPMYIQAGSGESLASGAIQLVVRAAKAGNEVHFHLGTDMPHIFFTYFRKFPEAEYAMDELTEFMKRTIELK